MSSRGNLDSEYRLRFGLFVAHLSLESVSTKEDRGQSTLHLTVAVLNPDFVSGILHPHIRGVGRWLGSSLSSCSPKQSYTNSEGWMQHFTVGLFVVAVSATRFLVLHFSQTVNSLVRPYSYLSDNRGFTADSS